MISWMKLVPISKVLFTIVMVIVTMSNFSNVNAQPTGQLTVVKEIDSSQLREGVDGPAPSPSQFNIQVTFSQGGNENDPGSSDGQDYFRAGGTTYSVTEDPNQISGITTRVEFDGSCGQNGQDDTIEVGTPKTCTVINHILSVGPGAVTGEGTSPQIASTSQDTEEFSFQSGLTTNTTTHSGGYLNIVSSCKLNNISCAGIADDLFKIVPSVFENNKLTQLTEFPPSERGRSVFITNESYPVQYEVKVLGGSDWLYVYPSYSYDCEGEIKANQTKQCNIQLTLDLRR